MINSKKVSQPLSITVFTKLQTTIVITRDKKLNVPITKTSTNGVQSVSSSSMRCWNSLNSKVNIGLASPELSCTKRMKVFGSTA